WTLPPRERPLGFSPDGALLLACSDPTGSDPTFTAFDAATGSVVETWPTPPGLVFAWRPYPARDGWRLEDPGQADPWTSYPLLWDGRDPWLLSAGALVRLADGARREWPRGWTAQTARAQRALLVDAEGAFTAVV